MKKIVSIIFILLMFTSAFASSKEIKLTKAIKRETIKSIQNFFEEIESKSKDVWGYTITVCSKKDNCKYIVDSYAYAQIEYSYIFATHECRTYIQKRGNQLIEDGSDCIFQN